MITDDRTSLQESAHQATSSPPHGFSVASPPPHHAANSTRASSDPTTSAVLAEEPSRIPLGFKAILCQAISWKGDEDGLSVGDIYKFIKEVHPDYTQGRKTWQSSVRHCLSANLHMFQKVRKLHDDSFS